MKAQGFEIAEINGKWIVVKGIGKLYYQDGFPIGMAIKLFKEKGWEVSWLHIADELQKNGWKPRKILALLGEDIEDYGEDLDKKAILTTIEIFLNCEYEQQREMIFHSLFDDDMKLAKTFFMEKILWNR